MTTDFLQIYPADASLRTPEREALFAELLEKADLGEFTRKTFVPALKRLVFEGQIESRAERIGGLRDPMRRINPLGTYVHAYLCLASPVVTEDAFVEILQHYQEASIMGMAINLVRRFDGTQWCHAGPQLQLRIRCLVSALARVLPARAFQSLCGDMFSGFLSRACYRGSTEQSLVTDCWAGVDAYVAQGQVKDSIHTLAATLFSGEAEEPAGYRDSGVLAFCERFVNRQFGPHLLALLDTIYLAVEPARRLRIEHGTIVFSHLACDDIAAASDACAAQAQVAPGLPDLQDLPDGPGAVEGTGLFCLVRSPSSHHSRDVARALRAAHAMNDLAQPAPGAQVRDALAPVAEPQWLQRVDDTALLLGWQSMLDVGTGRAEVAACTAAGCTVLAAALWLESGEVLHLHGLQPGQPWQFSRARPHAALCHADGEVQNGHEGLQVQEPQELLALLLAEAAASHAAPR